MAPFAALPSPARTLPTLARFCSWRRPLNWASSHIHPSRKFHSDLAPHGEEPERDAEVSALWRTLDQAFEDYRSQKLAPKWLPFRPDASYWIPPCPPLSTILRASNGPGKALSNMEILDSASSRSWTLSQTEPGPLLETDTLSEETENVFLELRIEDLEEGDEEEETD